jgi:hypothetical protein
MTINPCRSQPANSITSKNGYLFPSLILAMSADRRYDRLPHGKISELPL